MLSDINMNAEQLKEKQITVGLF